MYNYIGSRNSVVQQKELKVGSALGQTDNDRSKLRLIIQYLYSLSWNVLRAIYLINILTIYDK